MPASRVGRETEQGSPIGAMRPTSPRRSVIVSIVLDAATRDRIEQAARDERPLPPEQQPQSIVVTDFYAYNAHVRRGSMGGRQGDYPNCLGLELGR